MKQFDKDIEIVIREALSRYKEGKQEHGELDLSTDKRDFIHEAEKELFGHKTLAMTLRYSHLAPAHMVKAVDILDSTLTGKPTIQKLYNLGVRDQCLMSVSP
jgi:hypothetical protein